ncbi:MAG: sodium/solute symporter [Lewinellaceae bacterium]|nr:sodium/solute symporter [Lewinellaceae bacterium]MCB9287123.1 sodium/solute symporter [Lewinellaceae bacterium]
MEQFQLSFLDVGIMLAYAVLIIGYGIYHGKRNSSEEYFLAGRGMPWPIVGIALFSANISSSTLIGLAGDAYKTNIHVYNYEWFAVVVLIFFSIFFLPFYLRSGVYTMPEFLERRYDRRSRYYFSFITIVGNVLVDTAAGLYVGSIVLKLLFPSLPSWQIILLLAIAAAAYTIPGGLNSVIQTEVVQAVLLVVGSILLTYFAFQEFGGGWSAMMAALTEKIQSGGVASIEEAKALGHYAPSNAREAFSLVRPSNDEFMPWYGLLTGVPLLGFYFWANNQFMVQRVLGARDLNHGRWGALFAGLLKLPVIFIMVVPGTLALLIFSDLDISGLNYITGDGTPCQHLSDCANLTYPVLLMQLLPSGILGLVVAGLLAAMMSSVSATFNSASTLITMDFVRNIRPAMTSQQLVRAGQIATVILVVLAAAWVPFIEKISDSLWQYLQLVISYTAPPAVATFVLGLFWKRASATGSIASLLFGFFFAIFMLILKVYVNGLADGAEPAGWISALTDIHFLLMAFILWVLCLLVHVVVSLSTPAPTATQVADYTWERKIFREETKELKGLPWYKNYRILAVILLIITAIVVGYFW